jgi:hypothetical protein
MIDIEAPLRCTDPIERIVEQALLDAGVSYVVESDHAAPHGLDFHLPDYGVAIEVKQMHSDRIARQMATHRDVIAIQGRGAALLFATMMRGSKKGVMSYGG